MWMPLESTQNTWPITPITPPPNHNIDLDNADMVDISSCLFSGKPEDQDPQDFMNWLKRIILMKAGLSETDKVCLVQLCLIQKADKESFATARDAFELHWLVKAITEKTTAEKQTLLDETVLRMSNLGKRVVVSIGAEEELTHIVWADKVKRLVNNIPDTNNLLVASTRKKLPKPLMKLVRLKPMTWKEFADMVRSITLEELMEKIEEE